MAKETSGPLRDYWFEAVYLKGTKTTTMQGMEEAYTASDVISDLTGDREKGILVGARVWLIDEDGRQATMPSAILKGEREPEPKKEEVAQPNTVLAEREPRPLDLENVGWAYRVQPAKSNTYPTVRFKENDHDRYSRY